MISIEVRIGGRNGRQLVRVNFPFTLSDLSFLGRTDCALHGRLDRLCVQAELDTDPDWIGMIVYVYSSIGNSDSVLFVRMTSTATSHLNLTFHITVDHSF